MKERICCILIEFEFIADIGGAKPEEGEVFEPTSLSELKIGLGIGNAIADGKFPVGFEPLGRRFAWEKGINLAGGGAETCAAAAGADW